MQWAIVTGQIHSKIHTTRAPPAASYGKSHANKELVARRAAHDCFAEALDFAQCTNTRLFGTNNSFVSTNSGAISTSRNQRSTDTMSPGTTTQVIHIGCQAISAGGG